MEVAACSFPESKQIEGPTGPSRTAAKALVLCLVAKPVSTCYTKNMCHFGFQACQRDKAGSNCKSQLLCSFLKTLLLVWKVDVAELRFENANCFCLKPPITDSLLLSDSKEEKMLWIKLQVSTPLLISENPTSGVESRCC